MRRILLFFIPVLLLVIYISAGRTHSRFTDRAHIPDNIFSTAENFPLQTICLSTLAVGQRVRDSSWEWHHRPGAGYAGRGEIKPIVWIVIGVDHYRALHGDHAYRDYQGSYYLGTAVMLLAEEVIAKRPFDDSIYLGSNNWSDSWIRKWLNDTDYPFQRVLPNSLKNAILRTNIPNKYGDSGDSSISVDRVFILSETELGSPFGLEIGIAVEYFSDAPEALRKGQLGGNEVDYWTRSPSEGSLNLVRQVTQGGSISEQVASSDTGGYRPAVNLDGDTPVIAEPVDGIYEIVWPQP